MTAATPERPIEPRSPELLEQLKRPELAGKEEVALAGLYLHVPFCSAICPYCDFSVLLGGDERRQRFVETLCAEIDLAAGTWPQGAPFDTIYLGGGTPSLLTPSQLSRVLEAARGRLPGVASPRIYLEANPEDVTEETLAAWRRLGVGTLSLGVQSFDDDALRFLGRRHTGEQAREAVRTGREAGFSTLSLDLIYGLPGQSPADWRRELSTALDLEPDHLSCYQLTFHPQTPFGFRLERGKMTELPEHAQAELFFLTHRILAEQGFEGYEVSSFAAAPEHRSRHNRKYWDHTAYLGLGPSAHSFEGHRRWWNLRKVGPWEARVAAGESPVEEVEVLGPEEMALEALMLGLRTAEGVDVEAFARRHGVDLLAASPQLEGLQRQGKLVLRQGRLRPTLEGLAVADSLARAFDLSAAGSGS